MCLDHRTLTTLMNWQLTPKYWCKPQVTQAMSSLFPTLWQGICTTTKCTFQSTSPETSTNISGQFSFSVEETGISTSSSQSLPCSNRVIWALAAIRSISLLLLHVWAVTWLRLSHQWVGVLKMPTASHSTMTTSSQWAARLLLLAPPSRYMHVWWENWNNAVHIPMQCSKANRQQQPKGQLLSCWKLGYYGREDYYTQ